MFILIIITSLWHYVIVLFYIIITSDTMPYYDYISMRVCHIIITIIIIIIPQLNTLCEGLPIRDPYSRKVFLLID